VREGWEVKQLGDVLKLEYGKPLPQEDRDDNGAYPAYGANGVNCRSSKFFFGKESIIVGRKGSAGETTLTEEKFWPLDVTYFVTFDERRYDLIFLYHCLKSLQLTRLAKGVKPGLNRNDVHSIEFAFPPLPEQKRIVAILDKAFEGISAAAANAEKNLANARELFESYLNSVFGQNADSGRSRPP
jgi:type I restriction enzyme, S subunit